MRSLVLIVTTALLLPGAAPAAEAQKRNTDQLYFESMQAQASKDDVQAEECLAELYASGMGTAQDTNQALKLYGAAAAAGDLRSQERLAQTYAWWDGHKDVPKAVALFQQLIAKGYMPAATDLALLYSNGTGVPKDQAKALSLYRRAADADDPEAEMRLGLFYHVGDNGLSKDDKLSKYWLEKAASHKIYCLPTFGNLTNFIISGYLPPLDSEHDWGPTAPLNIMYVYHDGHAENAYVKMASGIPEFDQGWLDATRIAKLPPWPTSYRTDDKTLGFFIQGEDGDLDYDFASKLHDAIKGAAVTPLKVLENGSKGRDAVSVGFDYQDGKVSDARVATSSGDPDEDAAAIEAVKTASYPTTPTKYAHKTFHMGFNIQFEHIEPTQPAATTVAPIAVSNTSHSHL